MNAASLEFKPSPARMRSLLVTALLGALVFVVGLFVAPERAWSGYLMAFVYFVELGLAGGLFLSILTLSSARWATALRRVPEAMTTSLPYAFVLGLLLMGGVSTLYEWSHSSIVAADPLLQGKASYLNGGFFFVRLVVYFVLWIWLTRAMVRISRLQDQGDSAALARARFRYAALFLPVFGLSFSLASVDWVQSLEPHWFSTIFALITLSNVANAGLAVCILIVLHLRREGVLRKVVSDDQLDDLGKIVIGFALFWGYVWFCQYMLIWYTNMPEETPYYALRHQGHWQVLTWVNVTLNWAVPFFVLMPKAARRSGAVLARVAVVMLVGQALNLSIQIEPPLVGAAPSYGLWEVGPVVGALALFFWCTLRGLTQAPVVVLGDRHLQESLDYHC
jgi:hypothetical protein